MPLVGSSQEKTHEKFISVGGYAMGYPMFYQSYIIFGGALLDVSLKKHKRLCSSSSINFFSYNNHQDFSIASGLSWTLQNKNLCFRPGIQMGYLYQSNGKSSSGYTFNGILGRASTELTYVVNQLEFGVHLNVGIGIGPTQYYYESGIDNTQVLLARTTGIGIVFKYRITGKE